MNSANSFAEEKILFKFGKGIETWINKNRNDPPDLNETVRIGRWDYLADRPEHTLDYVYGESYEECDLAVMFGSAKSRKNDHHIVRYSITKNAKNFLVIETPLLNRVTDKRNTSWRVGMNGFLHRAAGWPEVKEDVASKKLKAMDIVWKDWQNKENGDIILALQLPGDASLRGQDISEWAIDTIERIRSVTKRSIVIRSHPLSSDRGMEAYGALVSYVAFKKIRGIKFSDGQQTSWNSDLKNAYCTITYTSGLAVDSVLQGIPTVACNPGNFAWGISSNNPEDVEDLKYASNEQINRWLQMLSMCQWSESEMEDGTAMAYLEPLMSMER